MADENQGLLNAAQRRVVAFALTLSAVLGSAVLLIGVALVLGRLTSYFSGVLWPLATAGVFALILRPWVDAAAHRLRVRRIFAVVLLYAVFLLLLGALLVLVLPPLIDQIIAFILYLPSLWTDAMDFIRQHYPQWVELVKRQLQSPAMRNALQAATMETRTMASQVLPSLRAAGGGLLDVFAFTTHVAVVPVYLFFFLLAEAPTLPDLHRHLPFVKEGIREDIVFLVREFVAIVESFFRGQLSIGVLMGVLYAVGYSLIGLKFGLFLGLAAGLLNIVPYLGTIAGLLMTLPLAFFQESGGWRLVGLVLVVKLIVQAVESWVLTPKIMGDRTGLHPVVIILAIFFWGTAFHGIVGMLLAIPLTAFFVTAWRWMRKKYFVRSGP